MAATALIAEPVGRRRRLMIVVGGGLVTVVVFVLATVYAERRVNDEDRRVRRIAATIAISDSDLINAAYASDTIGAKFGVANNRVTVTKASGKWCVAILGEYLTSSRVSSFAVGNSALTPTGQC